MARLDAIAAETAASLRARRRYIVDAIIQQVRICPDRVEITCHSSGIATALQLELAPGSASTFTFTADLSLKRAGRAMRLVQANGAMPQAKANPSLIQLLNKARRWWAELRKGEADIKTLARREGVTASYITRVLRLAFLSPALIDAILAGKQTAKLDIRALTLAEKIDAC